MLIFIGSVIEGSVDINIDIDSFIVIKCFMFIAVESCFK